MIRQFQLPIAQGYHHNQRAFRNGEQELPKSRSFQMCPGQLSVGAASLLPSLFSRDSRLFRSFFWSWASSSLATNTQGYTSEHQNIRVECSAFCRKRFCGRLWCHIQPIFGERLRSRCPRSLPSVTQQRLSRRRRFSLKLSDL